MQNSYCIVPVESVTVCALFCNSVCDCFGKFVTLVCDSELGMDIN